MRTTLLSSFASVLLASIAYPQELPRTQRLEWPEEDLSDRLMTGRHRFVERKIAEAPAKRSTLWLCDYSSPEAYAKSVEPNRASLRIILGVVDERLPATMERYGDEKNPALVAETDRLRIFQARWPVLDGFWGCGLLAEPKAAALAGIVVVPDAGQSPEELLGLAPGTSQAARRLAENGFEVVVPLTISRERLATSDAQVRTSDQTYREWIYRQAFHMGRHVKGYEVQSVLAAVNWLSTRQEGRRVRLCRGRADCLLRGGARHAHQCCTRKRLFRFAAARLG